MEKDMVEAQSIINQRRQQIPSSSPPLKLTTPSPSSSSTFPSCCSSEPFDKMSIESECFESNFFTDFKHQRSRSLSDFEIISKKLMELDENQGNDREMLDSCIFFMHDDVLIAMNKEKQRNRSGRNFGLVEQLSNKTDKDLANMKEHQFTKDISADDDTASNSSSNRSEDDVDVRRQQTMSSLLSDEFKHQRSRSLSEVDSIYSCEISELETIDNTEIYEKPLKTKEEDLDENKSSESEFHYQSRGPLSRRIRNSYSKPPLRSSSFIRNENNGIVFEVDNTGTKKELSKRDHFSMLSCFKEELFASYVPEEDLLEKREEVYNFIQVPFHLEKLLLFGFLLCLDSFLFLFTFMPIRIVIALIALFFRLTTNRLKITSTQIWDLVRAAIVIICFIGLTFIDASILYHYIRAQSTLKLYVIYNVLEIFDKLCCSFGQDIFASLFWKTVDKHVSNKRKHYIHLHPFSLFLVALIYTFIHSIVLFYQVVTLNVAINSDNNALLTLLVSNQFVELKGSVFKKFEKENLFQISCSDMVERFQLCIFVAIVCVQNFSDLQWNLSKYWIGQMLQSTFTILLSECLVDWVKHCFITRFNHFTPDVYQFFKELLTFDVIDNKSFFDAYLISKRIGFVPLPLACLVLRMFGKLIPSSEWIPFYWVGMFAFLCLLKMFVRMLLVKKVLESQSSHQKSKRTSFPNRFTMWNGKIP